MTDFGELVSDMQHKSNGNPPQHSAVPDWLRLVLQQVGKYVEAQVKPLRYRIAELENLQREFKYCGVWNGGTYRKGNFVTHDGSVWHCNCDTDVKPGIDPLLWTLAVKHGKDVPRSPTKGVRALTVVESR